MKKIIRGYAEGQAGGEGLVVIMDDELRDVGPVEVLGLPDLDPRLEARHSPTGFAWGYHGSGPAELARAILLAACPEWPMIARCPTVYQRFKAEVVGSLPKAGFELEVEAVHRWLAGFIASPSGRALVEEMDQRARLDDEIARLDRLEREGNEETAP